MVNVIITKCFQSDQIKRLNSSTNMDSAPDDPPHRCRRHKHNDRKDRTPKPPLELDDSHLENDIINTISAFASCSK